ncbi:MAG TPA: N-acetylmuramoyl-L-alanine amidase [Polyangiaceae bacterium]|jgi:N-acetylmuramoyl-L-alanine amidase|nr:N-acetylmuramoyl-L-alanine amidase [Polyangiaceae bacterium]
MSSALAALVAACSGPTPPPGGLPLAASISVGRPERVSALPGRAEVVARADELAVSSAKLGGAEGAKLAVQAAELRRRIWRVEGRSADGLESAELFRTAARTSSPAGCDASVELALLEGEMSADPTTEYAALYRTRAHHRTDACGRRAGALLGTLAAFAPSSDVLEKLDRDAPAPEANAALSSKPAIVEPPVSLEKTAEPAQITRVELYGGKEASRVVVFVTRPTLFEVGDLAADAQHAPRIFIDIKNTVLKAKHAYDGEGLIERVRLGEKGSLSRVVLDMKSKAVSRVFYLPEPFRLIVDVSSDVAPSLAEKSGPRHVRRVVLDPGHGGHDPGAMGASGLREKDVVLDIAHRAAPLVARELGIATLLTRDSDVYVPLDERVAHANAFSADLFVSIHCNASETSGSRGVMTFVLDASRDDLAMRVAARENAASAEASAELANAMSHVLDAASLARSNHFAELLQRAAVASLSPRYTDVVDQGVKSAGFYVLAGARMPAVLFETSFISNLSEERRLDSPEYRQKMADAVVNAVRAYRDGI